MIVLRADLQKLVYSHMSFADAILMILFVEEIMFVNRAKLHGILTIRLGDLAMMMKTQARIRQLLR